MARRRVGILPVQVLLSNQQGSRVVGTVEMLPTSIVAGNTGLIFGKFGSAPVASLTSNTWDFVLNSGSTGGTNAYQANDRAPNQQDLWIVSDTADQEVNVIEINAVEKEELNEE